jgi:hypothetical protein
MGKPLPHQSKTSQTEGTLVQTSTPTPDTTASTQRRGKIARLPRDIREQLNTRLDDGEDADQILSWLNALPAVQKAIATHFNGQPISPQNLSAWRKGGFQEWLFQTDYLDSAFHMREHIQELQKEIDADTPRRVLPLNGRLHGQPSGRPFYRLHGQVGRFSHSRPSSPDENRHDHFEIAGRLPQIRTRRSGNSAIALEGPA